MAEKKKTKRKSEKAGGTSRAVEAWDPFTAMGWADRLRGLRASGLGSLARELAALPVGAERWAPAIDISEDEDKYIVTAELPGTKAEDVHVEIQGDVLTVHGEKRSEREETSEQRRYVERRFGSFSRSFTLPSRIDGDRIVARFADGVLTVEIPKAEESKPRVISIGS